MRRFKGRRGYGRKKRSYGKGYRKTSRTYYVSRGGIRL